MSPPPLARSVATATASGRLPPIDPAAAPTALVATDGIDLAALRPFSLAIAATIAALVVGAMLAVGASSFTRTVSDDIADRPDLAFAAGFVPLFGLLVAVALPMIVSTAIDSEAATALAGLVSLPGLFLWGVVLLVGSCLGAVAVGVRLADRLGGSSSLVPAVVLGAVVLGASQLVPVFGAVVAMGLATVAIGAVARRRFDVDERLFDGPEPGSEATTGADVRERDRTAGADVWEGDRTATDRRDAGREPAHEWRSSEGGEETATAVRAPPENDWEWDTDTGSADPTDGTRSGDDGESVRSERVEEPGARTDEEAQRGVDHWEWGPETNEGEDVDEAETRDDVEENRTESTDEDEWRTW